MQKICCIFFAYFLHIFAYFAYFYIIKLSFHSQGPCLCMLKICKKYAKICIFAYFCIFFAYFLHIFVYFAYFLHNQIIIPFTRPMFVNAQNMQKICKKYANFCIFCIFFCISNSYCIPKAMFAHAQNMQTICKNA